MSLHRPFAVDLPLNFPRGLPPAGVSWPSDRDKSWRLYNWCRRFQKPATRQLPATSPELVSRESGLEIPSLSWKVRRHPPLALRGSRGHPPSQRRSFPQNGGTTFPTNLRGQNPAALEKRNEAQATFRESRPQRIANEWSLAQRHQIGSDRSP